jgi:hypothetical protein
MRAAVAQLAERLLGKEQAEGSNPSRGWKGRRAERQESRRARREGRVAGIHYWVVGAPGSPGGQPQRGARN